MNLRVLCLLGFAVALATAPMAAQRAVLGELLIGAGPAPGGDGLLIGGGVLVEVSPRLALRLLGTSVDLGRNEAVQGALLLQASSRGAPWRGYVAAGPMVRRVSLYRWEQPDQVDSGWGVLGVLGVETRFGRCERVRLFAEGHGIVANAYGGELTAGLRFGGGCRAAG
jgi:hypothetical protein